MPGKYLMYQQMAEQAAQQITGSYREWTGFLETAARLYKYPYHEQLMIYAQRPDATACAEYDFWNDRMRRYVRRGSRGIALIDTRGDSPRLRYVFDISDTGTRENARPVQLWRYDEEYADAVAASLERSFDISSENGLRAQLESIASQMAGEYWQAHRRDILDMLEDSFLEDYDDDNIEAAFKNAATVSIAYSLMFRCGLEPQNYFAHEDFLSIFDFNTPETVCALGTAVSEISQQVLRQIETTIRNAERAQSAERMEGHGGDDLQPERRLPDSRPDPERADTDTAGQVWQASQEVSAEAATGAVEQPAPVREAVPPSAGDRRDGEAETGTDYVSAGEAKQRDGGTESTRPADLDSTDEQSEGAGGGADLNRVDLQLNAATSQDEVEQLSLFPSQEEQIARVEEAEGFTQRPFAFSFATEEAELSPLLGSNSETIVREANEELGLPKPEHLLPNQQEKLTEVHSIGETETSAETGANTPVSARRIEDMDIEEALRVWNGSLESKRAVAEYMEEHAREPGAAAWLSAAYGGAVDAPLHISIAGIALEITLSWPQVQKRLAQMIRQDRFFTTEEKRQISERDAAEWLAVEQAKLPPLEYAQGDRFTIFGPDDHGSSGFILTQVTEDEVLYTFSDTPENAPVSMDREEFDRNLRSGHIREYQPEPMTEVSHTELPYSVGDTLYLEDGRPFVVENIGLFDVQLRDPSLAYPVLRAESKESLSRLLERFPQGKKSEPPAQNFRITDDHLGEGGLKAKFRANMDAINTLKTIELEGRSATSEEQEILSRYVG